jgi:probable HAF family extracellular repeat protein
MKPSLVKLLLGLIVFAALNLRLCSVGAEPPSFLITDLGAGQVSGINDLGQVVGQSLAGVPFIWSSKTGRLDLTSCYTTTCFENPLPRDINNSGQIVGHSENFVALRWDRPDKLIILPNFGEHTRALAINGAGLAVGGWSGGHNSFPKYWDKDAHQDPFGLPYGGVELPVLGGTSGGPIGSANGVNQAGVIVGGSGLDSSVPSRATLWRNYAFPQDLGTLAADSGSEAFAINNADVVVGDSTGGMGFYRAFLWTASDGMIDINPGADDSSVALAINDSNWIVGSFGPKVSGSKGDRAALWRANAEMDDLNSLVDLSHSNFSRLSTAVDINALGEIIGTGRGRDSAIHAFLLTPIPEMQTWSCMLIGLILVGYVAERAKRTARTTTIASLV